MRPSNVRPRESPSHVAAPLPCPSPQQNPYAGGPITWLPVGIIWGTLSKWEFQGLQQIFLTQTLCGVGVGPAQLNMPPTDSGAAGPCDFSCHFLSSRGLALALGFLLLQDLPHFPFTRSALPSDAPSPHRVPPPPTLLRILYLPGPSLNDSAVYAAHQV